jgi:hypothetical protein
MRDVVCYGHRFGPLGTLGEHLFVARLIANPEARS